MIGQELLLNYLDNQNINTFPRTLLLVGEEGCGKHTYSNLIAEKLKLSLVEITNNLTHEFLEELMLKSIPHVYYINLDEVSIKGQNVILKFIEEPLKNSFIVLATTNPTKILETVLNRCQKLNFKEYNKQDLIEYINENNLQFSQNLNLVLKFLTTPGQLKKNQNIDIINICTLCEKIIEKIKKASLPNTLSIINKINFKNEAEKIPLTLFNKVLLFEVKEKILSSNDVLLLEYFKLIVDYCNKCAYNNIDTKYALENLLLNLWGKTRLKNDT